LHALSIRPDIAGAACSSEHLLQHLELSCIQLSIVASSPVYRQGSARVASALNSKLDTAVTNRSMGPLGRRGRSGLCPTTRHTDSVAYQVPSNLDCLQYLQNDTRSRVAAPSYNYLYPIASSCSILPSSVLEELQVASSWFHLGEKRP
jgi:hypothetical protein